MNKFKLSAFVSINDLQEEFDNIPENYRQSHHLLYDSHKDKQFLINETVKYFIDKFSSPKTREELIAEVKTELNSQAEDIDKTCSEFFGFLCKKNILVPEDAIEAIKEKPAYLKPDDRFEAFKVEDLLSDRGYLEIYLVTSNESGMQSVIKLLNHAKTENQKIYDEELQELEREFSMMQTVKHVPGICQAYGFRKSDQYAYINLEYVKGLSVLRFLRNTEELTHSDCLGIIDGFVKGFACMHEAGLIHGDIHSSNVLVSDGKTTKIIDLGYSRKVDLDENELLPFGGVLHYMPPERINVTSLKKYLHDADLHSDVYQIGVLMYLVFYKNFPFDGFIWEELSKNIKESKEIYPELSFLNYPVAEELKNIIQKCLSKDPADRYKSAGEILQDFKKHAPEKELIN